MKAVALDPRNCSGTTLSPGLHARSKGATGVRLALILAGVSGMLALGIAEQATAQVFPLEPNVAVGTMEPRPDPPGVTYVVRTYDIRDPICDSPGTATCCKPGSGCVPNWDVPMYTNAMPNPTNNPADEWTAANIGLVFGLALDNDPNPNIYVTSTTVYSGSDVGTGSITKLDGTTGAISVFATLPNTGPGLGNIAFDHRNLQFYVTNHEDGQIYRLNFAGAILDTFDPFGPDDGQAGFASLDERIWGLQVNQIDGRLYFGTWSEDGKRPGPANRVYSVDLNGDTGEFVGAEVLEVTNPDLPSGDTQPISDISFSAAGKMLIAERGMFSDVGTAPHNARILQYVGGHLAWAPGDVFQVGIFGCPGNSTNSSGGIDHTDCVEKDACNPGPLVVVTADVLDCCSPPYNIYGLSIMPDTGGNILDSFAVDMDGDTTGQDKTNLGDVEVVRTCISIPLCGDGVLDPGEDCDPGAPVPGDCCDDNCMFELCEDGDGCTIDTCDPRDPGADPATGCVFTPHDLCADGIGCTNDSCKDDPADNDSFTCNNDANDGKCKDDDGCTIDTCDPSDPGADPGTGCVFTPHDLCDDGIDCTNDSCTDDPADNASFSCNNDANDGKCKGDDECTTNVCDPDNGCQPGTPLECDDGSACTDDGCDPASGCTHDDVDCDDGDPCTGDSCDSKIGCVHDAIDCDDGNACTDEGCDPKSGECMSTPIDCDDGDACTVDDCDPDDGCMHAPIDCPPGQTCVDGECVGQCEQRTLIVKQGACPAPINASSNGVIPILLVGTDGFDVHDVDEGTLDLHLCGGGPSGVGPIESQTKFKDLNHPADLPVGCPGCQCNDNQSSDGIDDLSMKFSTNDVVAALGLTYGAYTLELTGMASGAPFCARDCIIVVPPGSELNHTTVQSNVPDTLLEVTPMDLNFEIDGFADFTRSYLEGTTIMLRAPITSAGRRFLRWSVNGEMQGFGIRTIEVTISEDTNLRAFYQQSSRVIPKLPTEGSGDSE